MNNSKIQFLNLKNRLNSWQFSKLWYLDIFDDETKEEVIMAEMPNYEKYLNRKSKLDRRNVPLESLFMYEEPFLNKDQEQHLFRKYNFLKYKYKITANTEVTKESQYTNLIDLLESYYIKMGEMKRILFCANARLVSNLVKKANIFNHDCAISDGCMGLTRAVDYFDFRKGVKFITYAYLAVKDSIRRYKTEEVKSYVLTNGGTDWESTDIEGSDKLFCDYENKCKIQETLLIIPPRERDIISDYFGLNGRPLNLDEIGHKMRISKERVRQLKFRGLEGIRQYYERQE